MFLKSSGMLQLQCFFYFFSAFLSFNTFLLFFFFSNCSFLQPDGKVCGIQGMVCLSKFAENFTQPSSQIGCQCPQTCDVITYFPQIPKYTRWYDLLVDRFLRFLIDFVREYGYFEQRITFRWGLLAPTTKFRREVLFGFEDLVGR